MARKKKIREVSPPEALPPEEHAAPEAVVAEAEAPVTETPVTESEDAPAPEEAAPVSESRVANDDDTETTLDLSGSSPMLPLRDDVAEELEDTAEPVTDPSVTTDGAEGDVSRKHLRGLVEALIFASDKPLKANEIGKLASAPTKQVKELLDELRLEYANRGVQLDEIAGGWLFRTNMQFAPFVRDLTGQRPVRLSRAQLETLAIVAYRQPVTRPEVDDIRGVDCGAVLKLLLER
ncbi:MAG TPA: SMC-Scp complex subunit ScpB, partial [Polyangiaceae bacterium]